MEKKKQKTKTKTKMKDSELLKAKVSFWPPDWLALAASCLVVGNFTFTPFLRGRT